MKYQERVLELGTGKKRPLKADPPLVSSAGLDWTGFTIAKYRQGELQTDDICLLQHTVILQTEASITLEWKDNGRFHAQRILPGQVTVIPAYLPLSVRSSFLGEFLYLSLEREFAACASVGSGVDHGNLRHERGANDPLLARLLTSLFEEAQGENTPDALYAESVATLIAVHLGHKYTTLPRPPLNPSKRGLDKAVLSRTVSYIHEHIDQNVSLAKLAEIAGLSPYYFTRMFKQSVGVPPHEYLTRKRVDRAKELLQLPETQPADVAARVGFCDQSHLTRHFKRLTGLTPAQFARASGTRRH